MTQVNLDEAKAQLGELIEAALNGEEVQITRNGHSVKLVPCDDKPRRKAGSAKGIFTYMADDFDAPLFDAPLEDFKEYME
jgi:prevent-host-death family protein